jgi:hypothetical protein
VLVPRGPRSLLYPGLSLAALLLILHSVCLALWLYILPFPPGKKHVPMLLTNLGGGVLGDRSALFGESFPG